MTCSVDFQNAYVDLYGYMRNYIWDLDIVEMLADVEVDTYDAFIDVEKLSRDFQVLYEEIKDVAKENDDEDLLKSADAFKQLIDTTVEDDTPAYLDLYKVQEVAIDEDGKETMPQ